MRTFGSIIHDISRKHEDVNVSKLRRYDKLRIKIQKVKLDIQFLENCQLFQVTPKFIAHNVRHINKNDIDFVQKHVLKAEIRRHKKLIVKHELELDKVTQFLREKLSGVDFLILQSASNKNVSKSEEKYLETHEKKLTDLTQNHFLPFRHDEIITNRSSYTCTEEENDVLRHGLQHAIPPRFISKTDVFATFDTLHRAMKKDLKGNEGNVELKSQLSLLACTYIGKYKVNKKTLEKHNILKKLQRNKDIVITRPDKGNGVVILNKMDYSSMLYDIVGDDRKFKKLNNDKTLLREGQLQRFLRKLKKEGFFSDVEYAKVYPGGSSVARIYGLPKMHKLVNENDKLKLRPIVSCINAYNYELSSYLAKMLTPLIPMDYCAKDTFTFIKDIRKEKVPGTFMVSYDVTSLFTNIPLDETITIAVDLIFESNPNIKISKNELKDLFQFATCRSHFLFDGNFYDQVDGVAMGSPLGPVLANLFMSVNEKNWINDYQSSPIFFYKRYVDDIFCLLKNETEANNFLKYLNDKHPSIKFTMETEVNKKIPFLDILIKMSETGEFVTSVYRKSTFSGLFMNFRSFLPKMYKLGLILTLVDRVYKICHDRMTFNFEIKKVKGFLCKNAYPPHLIDQQIKKYLKKTQVTENREETIEVKNVTYAKLPFIGPYSKVVQEQIGQLCSKFCKDTNIKLVFTSKKISSFFSTKDRIPDALRSNVVYHFNCASCNASYVGQTTRHFDVRVHEHLHKISQPSSVFKHLEEKSECREACDKSCFKVIDTDPSQYKLKISILDQ